MGRWKTSHLKASCDASWSNTRCRVKIPRCRLLISLLPVSPTFLTVVYVISYIVVDKQLVDVPREKIRQQLIEVGFDDVRQADMVGGLSGGWKMKLELARAMLYNADLLLLDEVCFPRIRSSVSR